MKKFIRKHSPPDVEGTQQAPVSILKKSRLTEAVNTSIRKSVVISEKMEQAATEKQGLMSNMSSEPNSEDRDLGLKPRDMENDAQGTQSSVGDRERRKWVENAVPMSNNPYTKENIVRRKRSSNSGDFVSMRPSFETDVDVAGCDITSLYVSMYKRDYYMHHKDQLSITELAKSSEEMSEFSILPPNEIHQHERDSCVENLDDSLDIDNDDDAGTIPDSGVSEAGSLLSEDVPSEVSTLSVTDEIRRFQREINTVAVESSRFFKWKKERTPKKKGLSLENLSNEVPKLQIEKTDLIQVSNVHEDEHEQSGRNVSTRKSVSYYDREITSPSTPEENPHILFPKPENVLVNCSSGSERSRQIQPSTHVPPSYLPNGEATEELNADEYDDNVEHADDENDEVPALPSVRLLTSKFQTIEIVKQNPSEKNDVPAVKKMWRKQNNNINCYKQVHSITARSVSRQFRESLRAGRSELVDTIFKLPEAKNTLRLQEDTLSYDNNDKDRVDNIVYSSQSPHELYPDGDYIVTRRRPDAFREVSSGDKETRDW